MRAELSEHLDVLRRYALVLTRDPDQAEDLVQEALLRAMEGARTWKPGGDLRRWLLAIVHNTHISRVRRRQVEQAVVESVEASTRSCAPAEQPDRVHLNQTVSALMRLPDEHREVLTLIAMEGLSYKDAAGVLGIPIGTLMSRLGRAREALRAMTEHPRSVDAAAPTSRPKLRLVR